MSTLGLAILHALWAIPVAAWHWWPLTLGLVVANYLADCFITGRKVKRSLAALLPRWALPLLGLCTVIPGPLDEGLVVCVAVVMIAVQPVRISRARSAWRGGKVTVQPA